jgi:hypothetical protein
VDKTFWITLVIASVLSTPVFWLLDQLSQLLGQVPSDDALTHRGRRYSVWWEETTLVVGNSVCFAIMDAAVVSGVRQTVNSSWNSWLGLPVIAGLAVTIGWFANARELYKAGDSWGWQWCGPTEKQISFSGPYHTLYFFVQATLAFCGVLWLIWQPVDWNIRGFFLFGSLGYVLCFWHFMAMQKRLARMYDRPLN